MTTTQTNPLLAMLDSGDLLDFSTLMPEHAESAIDQLLTQARQTIAECLGNGGPYSWANLMQPIEEAEDRLERAFSPVAHMHGVMDSPGWREAYQACVPKLTAFSAEVGQNSQLYEAVRTLSNSSEFEQLDATQQRIIQERLRDFEDAGVALPEDKKNRYKEIAQRLSELATRFQQNVLDATQLWQLRIDEPSRLAGLPQSARDLLAQNAANKNMEGWLVTLDMPSFIAVMTHAEDRGLRAEVYEAFSTRASDHGTDGEEFDNSPIMDEILALRHEAAQLLGYDNYARQSLTRKMAESPDQIEDFLQDLARRSFQPAREELAALQELASQDGIEQLQSWDVSYYAEKLKQARYDFSDEDLRPYFPAPAVIEGLFKVTQKLYNVSIQARPDVITWHANVTVYEIRDADGSTRGLFYLDPYAREGKRSGAWMHPAQNRRLMSDGQVQNPVAFLTCNFTPPIGDKPALLTHGEVTTLFHEFGHGLHHMLTRVGRPSLAGISGVEWDAVELPSQFMENWCWYRQALDLFAAHYETGEPLPDHLFDKLAASRNHMAGWQMLRQIEFSLFDLRLHRDYVPGQNDQVMTTLRQVRDEVAVLQPPAFNRFPHGFMHIFAGGYAAGYYSYKWAEVLSADAFSAFEETDLFDTDTGQRFLSEVLERGATRDAMASFKAFRGREPSIDALLRHSGLAETESAT